jgi:hypothetical protein
LQDVSTPKNSIKPEKKSMSKANVVIVGLGLLLVANILMMYRNSFKGYLPMESFQNVGMNAASASTTPMNSSATAMASTEPVMSRNMSAMTTTFPNAGVKEAFSSYFLENGAGSGDKYQPMGAYDGVQLPTGNKVSSWRYTAPDEKLLGAEFEPGPDSLFMFKNNQCKPECCGSSFSCGGGCVCTTPNQRQYIASRGGNRTKPEDSA